MAREYEEYRDVLQELLAFTNGRHNMSCRELAEYDGVNIKTAKKRYGVPTEGIDVCIVAKRKCRMAHM